MKRHEDMRENCLYFDISKQERDSAIRYLLGAVINTRNEGDFPSNYYVFDEDVNVYLAHLLFAVALPEYHEMAEPYLSMDTSDILRWVRSTEDRTIRYFIFKVNADHLLMHTAVFDDLAGKKGRKSVFKRSEKHYRELAKLYYDQAAAYHKKIYRKKTGVGEVLGKLSQYFECYQDVLKKIRRDYFGFVNQFRDQAFHQFMNDFSQYEGSVQKTSVMDRFLDVYGRWLQSKDSRLKTELDQLARQLRSMDPNFKFDLNRGDYDLGGFEDEEKCA